MRINDDQNKNLAGRSVHAAGENFKDGLGKFPGHGRLDGIEPIRTIEADNQGLLPTSPTPSEPEDTSLKKILERLDALEERHLKYVNAHKARLSARLREAEDNEDDFLKESSQLRSDIYAMIQNNSSTENS